MLGNAKTVARWRKCKVLIIDEVSMLSTFLFELLDEVSRAARNIQAPFGGLQIILMGDFMQLPPILDKGLAPDPDQAQRKFCFQSGIWDDAGLSKRDDGTVLLEEVIRQKDDLAFVNILNEIRKGQISCDTMTLLNTCLVSVKELPSDGIIPTKLYCYNKDVDAENTRKLAELDGEMRSVSAIDSWRKTPSTAVLKKSILESISKSVPVSLELKVGAQVILLRNAEKKAPGKSGLVNGSRGVVMGFDSDGLPKVRFDSGEVQIVPRVEHELVGLGGDGEVIRKQIPLKLAW